MVQILNFETEYDQLRLVIIILVNVIDRKHAGKHRVPCLCSLGRDTKGLDTRPVSESLFKHAI